MDTFLGFLLGFSFGVVLLLALGYTIIESRERECLETADHCVFIDSHWVPATVAAPADQEGQ